MCFTSAERAQLLTDASLLQERGYKVCIVEKNDLQGRTQEWNISRHELEVAPLSLLSSMSDIKDDVFQMQNGSVYLQNVVKKGLITAIEIEQAIVTEFNPTRIGFKGSKDIWVNDVLNIGVSPR